MRKPQIDYAAVFRALPGMVALLTPELVYVDANDDFLRLTGRAREQLLGRYIFDVFPENPNDPAAAGMRETRESMLRAVATGERDTMALLRYDIEDPRAARPLAGALLEPGQRARPRHRREGGADRAPGGGGHRTHPRPRRTGRRRAGPACWRPSCTPAPGNSRRSTNACARHTPANARSPWPCRRPCCPPPDPVGHHQAAVRYRPAVGALNVCGDWYDLVDLPDDCLAVAVGDVVGHGLAAACVMGQLRSALSAAARVADGPARALEALGLYARSVDGAESTTAATAFIDWDNHTLTYSSAGHLPPALLHPDGTVTFLDRATDPPLGARPEHVHPPGGRHALRRGRHAGPLHRRSDRAPRRGHRHRPGPPRRRAHPPPPRRPRGPGRRAADRPAPTRRQHRRHRSRRHPPVRPNGPQSSAGMTRVTLPLVFASR